MAIPVTKPVASIATADLMRIVSGVFALEIASVQKNFPFNGGFRLKRPQPQFVEHKGYNSTSKMIAVDLTEPLETDHTEVMVELEGHDTDLLATFVNGSVPVYAPCRIWGYSTKDAADVARLMSSEFNVYAYASSEISYVREDWAKIQVTLRAADVPPTFTKDADTTP